MFKTWDKVVEHTTSHLKPDQPLPYRVMVISEIDECKDRDKECPKNCPGLISLDNKEIKCYAYEDTNPELRKLNPFKLVIKHASEELKHEDT